MNLTKKFSKPITAILIAASITSTVHASDFSNDYVLNGNVTLFNNPDVLYFRNAKGYTGSWGRFPHYATVNHHEFYLG